jgi:hypothetical protein
VSLLDSNTSALHCDVSEEEPSKTELEFGLNTSSLESMLLPTSDSGNSILESRGFSTIHH